MRLSGAYALANQLQVLTRDEVAEAAALERVAAWAGQFTSTVSLSAPDAVLLEIGGSLHLFGGLERLRPKIRRGIAALGYDVQTGIAPTPSGAWLLARAGSERPAVDRESLRAQLSRVPLPCLELETDTLDLLHGLGLRTVGDCLSLPRAGLARRFDVAFVTLLDRVLGDAPDPRPAYIPPPFFRSRLPLPFAVTECGALLFGIHRLVLELVGFLRARGAGVPGIVLRLHHEDRPPSEVAIGLVSAGRHVTRLMNLIRTRLEQYALPAEVHAVELVADSIEPLAEQTRSLLDGAAAETQDDWIELVERLRARLGDEAVAGLRLIADHRPERAWDYAVPGDPGPVIDNGPRPLWLLAEPLPLQECDLRGGVALQRGPERIESGWWDGHDVTRDYFVARHPGGMQWWIFRDRRATGNGERRWFLHGLFG